MGSVMCRQFNIFCKKFVCLDVKSENYLIIFPIQILFRYVYD